MSHAPSWQIARASGPLPAVKTSKYSALRRASSNLTLGGTSSTTRMRAVIGVLQLLNPVGRERFTDGDLSGFLQKPYRPQELVEKVRLAAS